MIRYECKTLEDAAELGWVDAEEWKWSIMDGDSAVFLVSDTHVELLGTDGGEPEDQRFYRDWRWVEPALNRAYALGLADGNGETAS